MDYSLTEEERENFLKLIEKAINYLIRRGDTSFSLSEYREEIMDRLIQLKNYLTINNYNDNEPFKRLLSYLEFWIMIRIQFRFSKRELFLNRPLTNLNLGIYEKFVKYSLIIESNELLNRIKGTNFYLSPEDKEFLKRVARSSASTTKTEYLGYGKAHQHNGMITLQVNRNYLISGTSYHCPFSFVDFLEGEYNFFWHTHCKNVPFSDEDKLFLENTGIPTFLFLNDGRLSLMTCEKEIELDLLSSRGI